MDINGKNTFEKIYDIVRLIPEGHVASYGQVAELAGNRRWARVVGYAMHAVPERSDIPWHRVVKKDGTLFWAVDKNGENIQQKLLAAEGVICTNGCVEMKKYQWNKIVF